jgi:hypothetical protein
MFCQFVHPNPTSVQSSDHGGRRLSFISLCIVAYSCSIPVNKTFPSKCLQRTLFSLSALSISRFHVAPLPFCCGEVWTVWRPTSVALYNLCADCTENFSRISHCCVSTNCRRDVFTSVPRSNVRDADLIENSLSEICLRSRCLATVCVNTPHYKYVTNYYCYNAQY